MARKTKNMQTKKTIYVFWEGESEEAYSRYLRRTFSNCAGIQVHREKGTFATARAYYRGNVKFHGDVEELDEIWFFFDTEMEKGNQWEENFKCLKDIIASRKRRNPIRIRLLMTSCCIEYWFLLHYERTAPAMAMPADKERILKSVQVYNPSYEKGDYAAAADIAQRYDTAIENGKWTLERLKADGMPERAGGENKESDEWLFKGTHTFTTVHEAVEMLLELPKLRKY
ncbi:MAG: RloB domain-containing protein [Hespellia sp.]|nr:RloB domain-containing protein [Hespellia sp.]